MNAAPSFLPTLNHDVCYSAMQSRDARFDGAFFVGVTSTGIYCRPVCKVRIPKAENCRFFTHAAVAEGLGFRACLRCRPALAPATAGARWSSEDASQTLAHQALALMDKSNGALAITEIAAKMGITDRHLRRIFAAQWGLSPQAYSKIQQHLQQDISAKPHTALLAEPIHLQLPFHAPYSHAHMLAFFAKRTIESVEHVDAQDRLHRSIRIQIKRKTYTGWICADFSASSAPTLPVSVSPSLAPTLAQLVPLLRAAFDLDANPAAIDAALLPDFPNTHGQRAPGCFDGFELAVRAVLGQQITVQAARTLALRLVAKFGEPQDLSLPQSLSFPRRRESMVAQDNVVCRLFPTATAIARAQASELGELGIVRQRQTAILGLALAVQNGLDLSSKPRTATELAAVREALCAIKGIGAWTAAYIAMRALRDPDAFPAGDVALQKALGISIEDRQASSTKSAKTAEALSQRWQPWRSYAVLRAWGRL
jgi:AraC family transcriptional regulator, regulatory protein of adaptative response / DNA-3-methyladenine glycosylase II